MIYIFENDNNNASWVDGRHLPEEYRIKGIELTKLPTPIENGKTPILKANKATNEVWYEYEDTPKTPEQIQHENIESVQMQLFETQTELLLTKSENERLGEQLFILQTNLAEKGVI